jgi:hypothetical protein
LPGPLLGKNLPPLFTDPSETKAMSFRFAAPLIAATLLVATQTTSQAFSLRELLGGGSHKDQSSTATTQPTARTQKAKQIEFLNRVRRSDPNRQTIQKAIFNEQNELGIILARGVQMDSIGALAKSLLAQEARYFPGQDLSISFYAPTSPPMKIGSANLNARTRDMTYQARVANF